MKKIALIILSFIIAYSATAKLHKHKKKATDKNQIISVSMHRTACYGRCPDYTININKDGTILYTGTRFVTDTGTFSKKGSVANASILINDFNKYKVDTCSDRYASRMTDVPGIIFTIQYKKRKKIIQNANFGPSFLKTLAANVDAAGNKTDNEGWEKITVAATNK